MVLWRLIRPSRTNTPKRCPFHYRGLECKSRKSRNTWNNRQIWPWSTEWSREKANQVLPRECTGHSSSHGLQHTGLPCPSPVPRVYSNSHSLKRWCHPTISSSVIPFYSHLQSSPASGSFLMSHFYSKGGPSIGVSASASVLLTIQDWFP